METQHEPPGLAPRSLLLLLLAVVAVSLVAVVMLVAFLLTGGNDLWLHVAQWATRCLYLVGAVTVTASIRHSLRQRRRAVEARQEIES